TSTPSASRSSWPNAVVSSAGSKGRSSMDCRGSVPVVWIRRRCLPTGAARRRFRAAPAAEEPNGVPGRGRMGVEYPVPKLPAPPHQRLALLATSASIAIAGVLFAEIVALDRLNIQLGYLRVIQNPPTDGFPITGPYGFWANSTPLERAWPYPVLAVAF